MSFRPPTSLPSIQFLLAQQTSEDRRFTKGHRSTRSVSSLPTDLQNLSLNGPSYQNTSPIKDDSQLPQAQPSWMNGAPPRPTLFTSSCPPSSASSSTSTHYPTSIAHHHQRSASDISNTPQSSSTAHPTSFHSPSGFDHGAIPQRPTTTGISPPLSLSPHHHHHQRQRHLSHRRAVSATTADHMMYPPSSSSTSIPPPVPPLPFYHRARSNSPPEDYLPFNSTNIQPADAVIDRPDGKPCPALSTTTQSTNLSPIHTNQMTTLSTSTPNSLAAHETNRTKEQQSQPTHAVVNGMELPRDVTGRYLCPFCQKAFSRPSSLRIHTYSHTKEKPFACPECPRQFSVQSNMRRHLRIHLIRANNKTAF